MGWRTLAIALWAALVVATLYVRSYVPIDETRYVSVAWEMWLRGDFLVPVKNGEPYADKPPLMFWVIALGWAVFGVNEWWPRVAVPLFALAAVGLTARLARQLWPEQKDAPGVAALVVTGTLVWSAFAASVMFDAMLACFVLVALLGVLKAARGQAWPGWTLYALGIGLGILAKGPVILLHVMPVALAAPFWSPSTRGHWRRWYWGMLCGIAAGIAIGLAWAVPAALAGGEQYSRAIFWSKWGGRVVDSIAHERPFWWYVPLAPLLLLPWSIWGPLWRGSLALASAPRDNGVRFAATWTLTTSAILSMVSGKQVHYLVPLVPAFSLLAARAVTSEARSPRHLDHAPFAALLLVGGAALALGGRFMGERYLDLASAPGVRLTGAALITAGFAVLALRPRSPGKAVFAVSTASVATLVALHLGPLRALAPDYDVTHTARVLKELEVAGRPIAHVGAYNDQYHFLGRLARPLQEIDASQVQSWARAHPDGAVVHYGDADCPVSDPEPMFRHRYRNKIACIYDATLLARRGP